MKEKDKNVDMLNPEENIFHERVNGTIERQYDDRREIVHLERLFGDRVKGAIGLRIRGIKTTSEYFMLLCSDEKNKRAVRIYLTHSQYGNTLRLTATEVIFRSTRAKKLYDKVLEEAKAQGNEERIKIMEEWKHGSEKEEQDRKVENKKRIAKAKHHDKELENLVLDMKLQQQIPEDIGSDIGLAKGHEICEAEREARIKAWKQRCQSEIEKEIVAKVKDIQEKHKTSKKTNIH